MAVSPFSWWYFASYRSQISRGEADEISFDVGFQVYQELLAAGWQLGRRCSGPRVRYILGEYDPNAKNEA